MARMERMKRMSDLPDELLRKIVGFLGAKEAAYVLVLSRRFRNLYSIVAELKFDDRVEYEGNFSDVVSETLAQLEIDTLVRRFSLKSEQVLDPSRIRQWLRQVLKRGVVDVRLSIHPENGDALPSELFTCSTVTKLKLGREFVITEIPKTASLPSLETLFLEEVRFYSLDVCAFNALLSACPILKELTIDGWCWDTWKWSGILSSQSLGRLVIDRTRFNGLDGADYQGISFVIPSLTYLDYSDFVPDAYPIVNLESLEEAKLYLQVVQDRQWHGHFAGYGDPLSSNPTNLIQGIRNVKVLELSYPLTFETLYCFRQEIPLFPNLHRLIIKNDDDLVCWNFLPFLLNKSPNLKTLILRGLHYVKKRANEENDDYEDYVCECVSEYACLLSCGVEVLDIYLVDHGTQGEFEQIEHFLGKLSCLELLTVRGRVTAREKSRIITHLLMLPRASPRCQMDFIL